eukprot:scaffold616_cov120-Isochrysis_galbana.AAC.4
MRFSLAISKFAFLAPATSRSMLGLKPTGYEFSRMPPPLSGVRGPLVWAPPRGVISETTEREPRPKASQMRAELGRADLEPSRGVMLPPRARMRMRNAICSSAMREASRCRMVT